MDDRLTRQAADRARRDKLTRAPWWHGLIGAVVLLLLFGLAAFTVGAVARATWELILLGWEGM